MFITQTYKYRYNNTVYVGGQVPEDAEILETLNILNAEEGYSLVDKKTKQNLGNSLWLKDGDKQDNYEEVISEPYGE